MSYVCILTNEYLSRKQLHVSLNQVAGFPCVSCTAFSFSLESSSFLFLSRTRPLSRARSCTYTNEFQYSPWLYFLFIDFFLSVRREPRAILIHAYTYHVYIGRCRNASAYHTLAHTRAITRSYVHKCIREEDTQYVYVIYRRCAHSFSGPYNLDNVAP